MSEVLYVEDSTTSQILMRRFLEGIAELTIASSLEAALQLLREHRFDLMIADYNFPEGIHSSSSIRSQRPMHHKMPVIVVSSSMGHHADQDLEDRRQRRIDETLKPADFRATVTRMLAAPYIRRLEHPVVDVSCFQWRSSLGIHQFCPNSM